MNLNANLPTNATQVSATVWNVTIGPIAYVYTSVPMAGTPGSFRVRYSNVKGLGCQENECLRVDAIVRAAKGATV